MRAKLKSTGIRTAALLLTVAGVGWAQTPAVGTRVLEFPTRDGPVRAQAWYPTADSAGRDLAPRLPERDALRGKLSETERRFAGAPTASYLGAAPLLREDEGWPVLLFSHGLGSRRGDYTLTIEALARRGFVVVAIDHRGGAASVAYEDGTVVELDPAWERNSPPSVPVAVAFRFAEERAEQWAAELVAVIDGLATLPWLTDALDSSAIGAFGHSMGGKAATALCILDARVSACANLDGWPIPASAEVHGLEQPYLLVEDVRDVTDEELVSWSATLDRYVRNMRHLRDRKTRMMRRMGQGSSHVMVRGIRHDSFQDWPALDPALRPEGASRDPEGTHHLIVEILSGFFGEHLAGRPSPLLHPDVIVDVFDRALWSRKARQPGEE